jgi:hypothetical protein
MASRRRVLKLVLSGATFAGVFLAGVLALNHGARASQQESALPPGSTPLDLKAGLWDVTVHMSSVAPRKILDTPELRKSMSQLSREEQDKQIAIYQQAVDLNRELLMKGKDVESKACLGNHNWETADFLQQSTAACTKTYTSTSDRLTLRVICPITPGGTPEAAETEDVVEIDRIDSENFKASNKITYSGSEPRVDSAVWTGKWIRPNCANAPTAEQIAEANAPVTARVEWEGNQYRTVTFNHAKQPMSAFYLKIGVYGAGVPEQNVYDARIQVDSIIRPGGMLPSGHPGKLTGVKVISAIFTDGSTFGDPIGIKLLMHNRRIKLRSLAEVYADLCEAQRRGLDRDAAVAAVDAHSQKLASIRNSLDDEVQKGTFDTFVSYMRFVRAHQPSVSDAMKSLQEHAAQMAVDPVKDANGNLYIKPSDAALACSAAK